MKFILKIFSIGFIVCVRLRLFWVGFQEDKDIDFIKEFLDDFFLNDDDDFG